MLPILQLFYWYLFLQILVISDMLFQKTVCKRVCYLQGGILQEAVGLIFQILFILPISDFISKFLNIWTCGNCYSSILNLLWIGQLVVVVWVSVFEYLTYCGHSLCLSKSRRGQMNLLKKIKIFKKYSGNTDDTKRGQSKDVKVSNVTYFWSFVSGKLWSEREVINFSNWKILWNCRFFQVHLLERISCIALVEVKSWQFY